MLGRISEGLRIASPDDLWDDEVRRAATVVAKSEGWPGLYED
jgi:hypothetical protein